MPDSPDNVAHPFPTPTDLPVKAGMPGSSGVEPGVFFGSRNSTPEHSPTLCHSRDSSLPSPTDPPPADPRIPPSSLDPHETSDGFDRVDRPSGPYDLRSNLLRTFRHSFWQVRRQATWRALRSAFIIQPDLFDSVGFVYPTSFNPTSCIVEKGSSFSSREADRIDPCSELKTLSVRANAAYQSNHKDLHDSMTTNVPFNTDNATPLRLTRYNQCGSSAWVLKSNEDPARFRVISNRCRDRFCEACQRERRATISNNVARVLEGRSLRLLTLTLKSCEDPLRAQLNRMYKCFRLFRNRRQIRKCITGGLFFLEITLNDRTGLWHPHLHIIFEGDYLPQAIAKRVWESVTGDSYIVDVRALRSSKEAADYISKYAAKGVSTRVWHDDSRLVEAILALSGRRTFSVIGKWRGLELSVVPHDDIEWVYFGRLDDVIILAKCGDTDCQGIIRTLLPPLQFEPADYVKDPPSMAG